MYHPFVVNLNRSNKNTLFDSSNRICIADKTKYINRNAFNMIARINESKTLTKHLSCKGKRKFDGPKNNPNQKCG